MKLDRIDKNILRLLQQDATLSVNEISEKIGLSSTPCWRRIQNLEKRGVIKNRVALVDPSKINLGVTVFVEVKTSSHNVEWLEKFATGISRIDEVVEFYRMSGDVDYLLKVVVPDIKAFDDVYKRLIQTVEMFDVSSHLAMEQIKYTTALPLNYLEEAES